MYKVIFLHIPKTAGTTFRQIIRRNYTREERFGLDGEEKYQTGQKLKNLSNAERNRIKLVGGHINFGLHTCFADKENVKYITFLRDPILREVSYYNYVLRIQQHVHHQEVVSKKMSLEDYISSDLHVELANAQTKQIAGVHTGLQSEPVYLESSIQSGILETAKNNIKEHFVFSGITEQFDQGVILLYKTLKWKFPLYYKSTNIAPVNQKYSRLSDKTLQLIADQNQADLLLYEYVKKSFTEQVEYYREYINRQIQLLKITNFLYSSYLNIHSK